MEYSIKPKSLGERRIIHYPQKRIIGLYVCYGLSHFIDEDGNIIGDYPVDLNDMSVLEENMEQQQEELEIMVEQNNVAEDDILEIKIVIDSLW